MKGYHVFVRIRRGGFRGLALTDLIAAHPGNAEPQCCLRRTVSTCIWNPWFDAHRFLDNHSQDSAHLGRMWTSTALYVGPGVACIKLSLLGFMHDLGSKTARCMQRPKPVFVYDHVLFMLSLAVPRHALGLCDEIDQDRQYRHLFVGRRESVNNFPISDDSIGKDFCDPQDSLR
ncbi:hypothetical protein ACLOJK_032521 [Asimina triloba]